MTDRNLFAPLRTDDEFDAALTRHFPPIRRRMEPADFVDTIAVQRPEPSYRPLWMDKPACSGACDQGRRACITPDACRVSEDSDAPVQAVASWLIGVGLVGAIVLVLAAVFWRPM